MFNITKTIGKIKRESLFLGFALIIIGVLFIVFPESSTLIICYATGISIVVWGIMRLIAYFQVDSILFGSFGLVQGLALLMIGCSIIFYPEGLAGMLTTVFAIVMMVDSVMKFQYAIDLMQIRAQGWIYVLITSILLILLSCVIVWNPFAAALTLMMYVGCVCIVDGVSDICVILYISRTIKQLKNSVY